MIPLAYITEWREFAPWPDDFQVEQDLILSKILIDIFSNLLLSKELAFRGGTALHKLFFSPAMRYSEDIDLVRIKTGEIKPIIDQLRSALSWLGEPKTTRNTASFKLLYFFSPENFPTIKLRIKIEINTRENFSVLDYFQKPFQLESSWFVGKTNITTYQIEELLATKLRALYQRKKGRDLFDIWLALRQEKFDIHKMISVFQTYMQKENNKITRNNFEKNIDDKLSDLSFIGDIGPLLAVDLEKQDSTSILTEKGDVRVTDGGGPISTEGWDLYDAAKELKSKVLYLLD
ncbi:MAG: nucleotidyl transferase AbiEii/AbiGii toxin family protein [Gammaproteobacteria bacterium]|nr:nucleotidyl transferase AbiEii/AbiGii toxin family protein [Gammaproteobacteria bacterium]